MKKETLYKKLYQEKEVIIYNEESIAPLKATEEDLRNVADGDINEYFDYLNRINTNRFRYINTYNEFLLNDCRLMRKIFMQEKLKEVHSRSRITCIYTLAKMDMKNNYDINEFLHLLTYSSIFNESSYSYDKSMVAQEVRDIRDIEELKKYVLEKIDDTGY